MAGGPNCSSSGRVVEFVARGRVYGAWSGSGRVVGAGGGTSTIVTLRIRIRKIRTNDKNIRGNSNTKGAWHVASCVGLHKMPEILGKQSPHVYRAYLYRLSGASLGVLYVRISRKNFPGTPKNIPKVRLFLFA